MALEDVRAVLGRAGPGPLDPLDQKVLARLAPPGEMREIRDAVLDLYDEVTLEGAEDEDLRGELINEADVAAFADATARFATDRPDIAGGEGPPVEAVARYGQTYTALGQVERAADALQLGAHTAVLLLSADLTRQNESVRGVIAQSWASADAAGRCVLDALFGDGAPLGTAAAKAQEDRRERVRLIDEQGARAVKDALGEAQKLRAQVRGAALRDVPLPPLSAPSAPALPAAKGRRRKP